MENIFKENKMAGIANFLFFGSLFTYVLIRAFNLSFTHDECLSYFIMRGDKGLETTANNHLLNTALMRICSGLFGDKEIFLRLPNVLAFIVYSLSCYRILKETKNKFYLWFGISLLFLNPFLIDFFSLARGYGLSLGFMAAALYFFVRDKNGNFNHFRTFNLNFIKAMICSSIALFSNLALVNFYIAVLFLFLAEYVLLSFKWKNKNPGKHIYFLSILLAAFIPLLFGAKRLLFLKEGGDLYFGVDSFELTIISLSERSLYFLPCPGWLITLINTFMMYLFPVGVIITVLMKNFKGTFAKVSCLIALILTGLFIENKLFSALYPVSRTGIYLIPLFGFFLYYFLLQFIQKRRTKIQNVIIAALLLVFSLPLSVHFLSTMSLTYTSEWKYDSHTKHAMEGLEERIKQLSLKDKKVILEADWVFGPAIKYYIDLKKLNVQPLTRDEEKMNSDFLYDYKSHFDEPGYLEVLKFDDIETRLYERRPND